MIFWDLSVNAHRDGAADHQPRTALAAREVRISVRLPAAFSARPGSRNSDFKGLQLCLRHEWRKSSASRLAVSRVEA